MSRSRVFTRRDIESRIAAGDTLVIKGNDVLRLNNWQDAHPGGTLVIQHMVGRDATDELNISHSPDIIRSMSKYRIGCVEGEWEDFVPPIQGGVFRQEMADRDVTTQLHNTPHDSGTKSCASQTADSPACTSVPDIAPVHQIASTPSERTNTDSVPPTLKGWKIEAPDIHVEAAIKAAVDADLKKYPSLDPATQRDISRKYRALHQRVHAEGYYDCRYSEYAKEVVRYSILFGLCMFFLKSGWYITSAAFLGFWWQQIMFTAHDAGHRGVTHNFVIDNLIAIFIGNLCCGLSIGWWKSSHNVHHVLPNHPVHDPDTQNIPLFSISPAFFGSVKSSYYNGFQFMWDSVAEFTVQYQKWTYYPVMCIARFNLYYLSWLHLMSRRSVRRGTAAWVWYTEVVSSATYIYLAYLLLRTIPTWQSRLGFIFVSHLTTLPLQIQITLSHWGTSTSDLGPTESFAQRQLRTTMDIACPEWLDFIHGGLQFQAIHHLFPRVPRHNYRRLQSLVKDFCADTGIEYQILGFVDGNRHVLGKLQHIADQAKILAACQADMAMKGQYGLH